ncbi:MAG: hypothetical protein QOI94_1042 [Acidobacteriaceae bacterium]|nr:hypothetical protein [Acidobacteriaceae bacterium]
MNGGAFLHYLIKKSSTRNATYPVDTSSHSLITGANSETVMENAGVSEWIDCPRRGALQQRYRPHARRNAAADRSAPSTVVNAQDNAAKGFAE